MSENSFSPFLWKYENAESLSTSDNSFDYAVIHAAIHHASTPHSVLTEMYRVAKIATISFESRDSMIMKIFEKLKITQSYEHAAVFYNDCSYGGVNNTEIPNYVYRWTEREIEKCIKSFAPYCNHNFVYKYGTAFPETPKLEKNGAVKFLILKLSKPFYNFFTTLFPKQQNLFAFKIVKPRIPEDLKPWLSYDKEQNNIKFNALWANQKYKKVYPK
jgi:ubiquinone/menaquinone biosynthesis C-methylase UbiE